MRSPGEGGADGAAGRLHGSHGRNPGSRRPRPRPAGQAGDFSGPEESSVFVPGYRASQDRPTPPGRDLGQFSWRGVTGVAVGKGPVRGYPPAPGQPPPRYPPGQFAAWNRAAHPAGAGQPDRLGSAREEAGPFAGDPRGDAGTGYPALAVSDQVADVTCAEDWVAIRGGLEHHDGPATAPGTAPGAVGGTARAAPGPAESPGAPAPGTVPPEPVPPGPTASPGTAPGGSPRRGTRGRGSGTRGSRGTNRRRGGTGRGLAAAGLVAALALAGGAYYYVQVVHDRAGRPAAAPPPRVAASHHPVSPAPSPSASGQWGHIASRSVDQAPLTLAQLFPTRFTIDGSGYGRTIRRKSVHCRGALIGTGLQNAVHRAGCTQVLRASYLSAKTKLMGTIGVLNLRTFASAERAGTAAGPHQFIAQLAASRGPTSRLARGTGIEEADVKGHYLILVWGEFTSLRPPRGRAQRHTLEKFLTDLINKTANVSLTARMVNGHP